MASSSSSHQQDQQFNAFSEMEPAGKRWKVSESSRVYDVFINHRGPDVKGTLATQLYNSLRQFGIEVFLDSEEKELGHSFLSIIEKAIRSAKVHIAIFSKRYAESAWCLNELVLMLESTAQIIPVFYQVKPSDLRHTDTGVYAEAFIKHKEKGRYLDKLTEWKEALGSLSLIAGEELEEFKSECDCQKIVAAVQKEVQRKTCLHVAEYPVGLNNLVEDFERQCRHKAQAVGIFSMGGAGKTTLAKELFNRELLNYKRASFLFDVREKSATSQLPSLQGKLIKDLFDKEISFTSTNEGTTYLKDRFRRVPFSRGLIVVDDVDHVEQLNALAVMDMLKNSGNSLVIVTTRDAGVLIAAGITVAYNLKGMDKNYARQLFCWHAFRQAHPCSGYEVLVDDFVDVCGGLPLSLQVLGSHVHGRPHSYWTSELIKVNKTLPRDVKQRLFISFNPLDGEEKQVFMDTACFFVGKLKSTAERIWKASGWNAQLALETLKDRCLVEEIKNLSQGEIVLRMHDHLRDLGREMALELSPPHRLWRPQDLKSLKSMGLKAILTKTNVRCFSSIFDESMGSQVTFFLGQSDSCLETSAFLPWLELEGNSKEQPSIPSWIPLQNLHCLKIRFGQLKTLWDNRIQAPSQLKELQISQTSLTEFPDILGISNNLENVFLDARGLPIQGLSLLESLRMNLSSLCLRVSTLKGEQASTKRGERTLSESLVIENFKFNGELDWNNGKAPMSGLEKLEISDEEFVSKILMSGTHYPSLESIELHHMKNLMEVDLTRVKILSSLDIRNCEKLKRLAATSDLPNVRNSTSVSGIPDLRNLAGSKVKECTDLVAVDHFNNVPGVSRFRMLAQLKISECPELEELRLGHLSCLENITIQDCNNLKYLCFSGMKCLESIGFLRNVMVKYFELDDCQKLKIMPFDCQELVELSIRSCPELRWLPYSARLSWLERIAIDHCGKLEYLQLFRCRNLKSLSVNSETRWLTIKECPELEELPCLSRVNAMETILIDSCEKIQKIRLPTALIRLSVRSCRDFRTLAGIGDILELRELTISNCPELEDFPSLSRLSCLEKIVIDSCDKIQNIRLPTTLISLFVKSCRVLRSLAGTGDLLELREPIIRKCPELEELPCLFRVDAMEKIEIDSCEKIQNITLPTTLASLFVKSCRDLQSLAGTGDLLELRELTIRKCPELEELPCLSRVNAMEKIEINSCEKIQNIRLPTALICLSVESCRDLQTVAGTCDLLEIKELTIRECPELEELSCLSRVNAVEKIEIDSCEKIKNIRLPTTLISLFVKSCTDLQTLAGTGDLLELRELTIRKCPELEELPCLSRVNAMEKIEIDSCEKIKNIRLPTTLISLFVKSCTDLQTLAGTGDLLELRELTIRKCPELEELPCLSRVNAMEKIEIDSCEKIQNITLPTTLICLSVESCRDLQTVVGSCDLLEIKELIIRECPQLEELSCLSRVNAMEKIEIDSCEKIRNIRLPTTLISLFVKSFRDLRTLAGTGDPRELRELTIRECPELEELPCLSRVHAMETIVIDFCEKIQNIRLPIAVICLSVKSCRDLRTVSGTGEPMELRELIFSNCPELEEFPSLSRMSCLEKVVIDSCEKLQNIAGIEDIEELHASEYMKISYCSSALIRNCIHKWKRVSSKGMDMIGRAADGAASSLNENLLCGGNIGVHGVIEIGTHETYPQWSEWRAAIILCLVVVVDNSTSLEDINGSLEFHYCDYENRVQVREGEWIIIMVASDKWPHTIDICRKKFDVLRRHGVVKKAFRVEVKAGESWKTNQVLSTIVDRLYHL